ncbi:MAG: hypothetical protein OXM01_07330 [Gemmatimonadota bacterium]|nr:hypothetical protein [Gemmatimonadota bacterium]
MPQVEYFDWSELADFDESHRARTIRLLREATSHVERLTLRQAIAEAAQSDASVWAAFLALWLQIRDARPHSERPLMHVIEQYESDMGWTARAARELIRNAIDAYHTTRIDRHVAEFEVGRFEAGEAGIYASVVPQVAQGTLSLADAALQVEHKQGGTD